MFLPLPSGDNTANQAAVVLFSGGQDSTTCLFWAKKFFAKVYALAFDYGQRHQIELSQAEHIAKLANVPFRVLPLEALKVLGGSSLTDTNIAVGQDLGSPSSLPNSFVPGRNLLFISLSAAYAYPLGARHLVSGMCQTDYSGYPDCRQPFADAAASAISLAMDKPFCIQTPLMYLNKAQTWQMAQTLDCLDIVKSQSHTCYNGNRENLHEWGYGCGHCPACQLRANGYREAFGS